MFYQYKVGERVMSPGPDGVVFDLTDGGGVLIFRFSRPTAAEKREFKRGISIKFAVVDDIIFVLSRLGTDPYLQDAPYYRARSRNLTHIDTPGEGQGLAIHAMLIDSSTGVLVAQKLFSPDHNTSTALLRAIQEQPEIPDYDARLNRIMAAYSTEALVRRAVEC